MPRSSRQSARILAFKIAYQREQIGYNPAGELLLFKKSGLSSDQISFTRELIKEWEENKGQIDKFIEENLTNWKRSRLESSLNALLQTTVAELQMDSATAEKVIFNEALEICRQYVGEDAIKICNAVLDAIWRAITTPPPDSGLH